MRQRSPYPKPFKVQVVQEWLLQGAMLSSVVISHGINGKVNRKWLPLYRDQPRVCLSLRPPLPIATARFRQMVPIRTSIARSRVNQVIGLGNNGTHGVAPAFSRNRTGKELFGHVAGNTNSRPWS